MSEFIISSEQLERFIEGIEHDTGRKINKVVCDGTELPEIVRCRDCKYYEDYTGCCTRRDCVAPMAVTAGGFCAWGEMRGDE